jgi:hypothetical protein
MSAFHNTVLFIGLYHLVTLQREVSRLGNIANVINMRISTTKEP